MTKTQLIWDLDAERACLGACLAYDGAAKELAAVLEPEDFLRQANRIVFGAIRELVAESRPVDFITVAHRLKARGELEEVGGHAALADLEGGRPPCYLEHARIVKELSTQRAIAEAAETILALSSKPQTDFGGYVSEVRETMEKALPSAGRSL